MNMDFDQRLQRAIERGSQTREKKGQEAAAQAMSEEDLKNLHTKIRLELSEHIEACLKKVRDHFRGFQLSTAVREGWGAKITRDELSRGGESVFSLLEMVVRPYSTLHIVELSAKGTIRNKEVFHRNHFQPLSDVNLSSFRALIDQWILEFAEQFSATA